MTEKQGHPVWFELHTPDAAASGDFYAALAGWQVAPSPMAEHGGYLIASTPEGVDVAGLMTPPPQAPAAAGWSVYLGVEDVDDAARRISGLGGSIAFGPADIPHVGRFAVAHDPQGVAFTIMRGTGAEPSRAFEQMAQAMGHGVWIELATPDPDAAFAFYGALFGWEKAGAMPMGDMGEYAFIGKGQDFRPGAIMSSALTGAPARWNWYVNVPDIDAAIVTAQARGGALVQGPDPIPGGDHSANITDPHGHQVGLVGPRKEK